MTQSFFLRKFAALSIALMLVVPGFYTAVRTQRAFALDKVFCTNCSTIKEQLLEFAKAAITAAQTTISAIKDTITAAKTTYLVLKESVLDPIARLLGAALTDSLTQQMFSFIATGNKGAPAFVTNPQKYFGSVAEESTQVFLSDLRTNRPERMTSINEAVRRRIIEENYVDEKKLEKSTFPGGDAAYNAYLKDPASCPTGNPWDCYFATLEPQNDPFQIYLAENRKLAEKRTTDVELAQDEVLAGHGFHTLKDCIEKDVDDNCTEYLNKTPGDTLARQINEYLTASLTQAENVDEIEEVVGVITGISGFLKGKGLANL